MNNSLLPIEIMDLIIGDFISEHADKRPKLEPPIFLPQWYLIPLLRVCRPWHAVAEKYLYRTVAVGSNFHEISPFIEDEARHVRHSRIRNLQMTQPRRSGYKIAEDLLVTLVMNTRLASLVKNLCLGLEPVDGLAELMRNPTGIYREWTQTNISILRLCPNVNQVEIRGFAASKRDSLFSVLKNKSLASVFISPWDLANVGHSRLYSKHLFDLMQNWPNLRSITAYHVEDGFTPMFDASQAATCCPELRDVIFKDSALSRSELEVLCAMCSGVARLEVTVSGDTHESLDALCDCLRAWSSTLKYLSLNLYAHILSSYHPLSDSLSSLSVLRKLVLIGMKLDVDAISKLPRLEQLTWSSIQNGSHGDLIGLSTRLGDAKKFQSLKSLSISILSFLQYVDARHEVEESCVERSIDLRWVL